MVWFLLNVRLLLIIFDYRCRARTKQHWVISRKQRRLCLLTIRGRFARNIHSTATGKLEKSTEIDGRYINCAPNARNKFRIRHCQSCCSSFAAIPIDCLHLDANDSSNNRKRQRQRFVCEFGGRCDLWDSHVLRGSPSRQIAFRIFLTLQSERNYAVYFLLSFQILFNDPRKISILILKRNTGDRRRKSLLL